MGMNIAKWTVFQNRCKRARIGNLREIESLARKVSQWPLSGQAGVKGESDGRVDGRKDL